MLSMRRGLIGVFGIWSGQITYVCCKALPRIILLDFGGSNNKSVGIICLFVTPPIYFSLCCSLYPLLKLPIPLTWCCSTMGRPGGMSYTFGTLWRPLPMLQVLTSGWVLSFVNLCIFSLWYCGFRAWETFYRMSLPLPGRWQALMLPRRLTWLLYSKMHMSASSPLPWWTGLVFGLVSYMICPTWWAAWHWGLCFRGW